MEGTSGVTEWLNQPLDWRDETVREFLHWHHSTAVVAMVFRSEFYFSNEQTSFGLKPLWLVGEVLWAHSEPSSVVSHQDRRPNFALGIGQVQPLLLLALCKDIAESNYNINIMSVLDPQGPKLCVQLELVVLLQGIRVHGISQPSTACMSRGSPVWNGILYSWSISTYRSVFSVQVYRVFGATETVMQASTSTLAYEIGKHKQICRLSPLLKTFRDVLQSADQAAYTYALLVLN